MLFYMFDSTAAAVEEGRINVEAVAPEPAAEALANEQREQQQQYERDARAAAFRSRDRRLRRAVRARRIANSNRATARYIAASRGWGSGWASSAGD